MNMPFCNDFSKELEIFSDKVFPNGHSVLSYDLTRRGYIGTFLRNFINQYKFYIVNNDIEPKEIEARGIYDLFEGNPTRKISAIQVIRIELNQLVAEGVLNSRKQGQSVIYSLEQNSLDDLKRFMNPKYDGLTFNEALNYASDNLTGKKGFLYGLMTSQSDRHYAFSDKIQPGFIRLICLDKEHFGEPVTIEDMNGLWTVRKNQFTLDHSEVPDHDMMILSTMKKEDTVEFNAKAVEDGQPIGQLWTMYQ